MKNGLILAYKLENMDVIKILGLVKSFNLCDVVYLWCLYPKWINQVNKRLFYPYKVSKKYNIALFWPENWDIWM